MNRIILIGNGFDLAHGLKTSYNQFIDSFWKQKKVLFEKNCDDQMWNNQYQDEEIVITDIERCQRTFFSEKEFGYYGFIDSLSNSNYRGKLQVKSEFIQEISKKRHLQSWVDIEEEYYTQLLACVKNHSVERKIEKLN